MLNVELFINFITYFQIVKSSTVPFAKSTGQTDRNVRPVAHYYLIQIYFLKPFIRFYLITTSYNNIFFFANVCVLLKVMNLLIDATNID